MIGEQTAIASVTQYRLTRGDTDPTRHANLAGLRWAIAAFRQRPRLHFGDIEQFIGVE